eukprot:scaffold452645_cov31-Prasinocladus_malaysianus.AAC.1
MAQGNLSTGAPSLDDLSCPVDDNAQTISPLLTLWLTLTFLFVGKAVLPSYLLTRKTNNWFKLTRGNTFERNALDDLWRRMLV